MGNYSSLNATINANIKQNGNQEITGILLNSVLRAMVTELGANYHFAGVATTSTQPGSPDQNVFYIAPPGTYPNFGGTIVKKGYFGVFTYRNTWSYSTINISGEWNYNGSLSSLDDATEKGVYFVNASTPNLPVSSQNLLLLCFGTGAYTFQVLAPIQRVNTTHIYFRCSNPYDGWGNWRQVIDDISIAAFGDVIKADVMEYVDDTLSAIYELLGVFVPKSFDSQTTGAYAPDGTPISSSLKTYWYNVEPGDVCKVAKQPFSSGGFSIVALWDGETFVKSVVSSPVSEAGVAIVPIPSGVTRVSVTYWQNALSILSLYSETMNERLNQVEGAVNSATRNVWGLPLELDVTKTPYVIGEVGKTIIPAGTYVWSFLTEADGAIGAGAEITAYYVGGGSNLISHQQGAVSYRVAQRIEFTGDVERLLIRLYNNSVDGTLKLKDIQLEVLDWNGYTSSPQKGSWAALPYGTPFIDPNSPKDIVCREALSYWQGKTINYNGDSVTQGVGTLRTGYVKVANQILKFGKVNNYAIGGTRLAHVEDVPNCMVDRISDMSLDADIIFIMANTNDYASQVPIGASDSQDGSTYNGAMNIIFSWLKTNYPTQPIIISTMLKRKVNYDGQGSPLPITIDQYANAVRSKVAEYGFILYDAYEWSGLDQLNTPKDGTGISDDGLHPNEAGALSLGRKVAAFINAQ